MTTPASPWMGSTRNATVLGEIAAASAATLALSLLAGTALAGQPNQSCEDAFPSGPVTPAGFNTTGFQHATTLYAGAQDKNSKNPKSVSQYDVACFQAAQHSSR